MRRFLLLAAVALAVWPGPANPAWAEEGPGRISVVGPDGGPLAGARLSSTAGRLAGREVFDVRAKVWATSDERGQIVLGALRLDPERRYAVWAPGLAPALVPKRAGVVHVRLLPARQAHGRIRLARDRPAAGLDVIAIPRAPHADLVHASRTDAKGAYRFAALHAGTWEIFLRRGAARLQRIGLSTADGALAELRLGDTTSIRGRLLDADGTHRDPAGDVGLKLVALRGGGADEEPVARFRTDADGAYQLRGLAAGIYEVQMDGPGWAFEPRPPQVEVQAGRERDLPTWFAVRRQRVNGTVLDEAGDPVRGASLRLIPDPTRPLPPGGEAEGTAAVFSDPKGRFVLLDVAPGEGYRLIASATGRSAWTSNAFAVDRGAPTELKPFRLRRGWRVALRVRTLDGVPVGKARVTATAACRPTALDDPLWKATTQQGVTAVDGTLLLTDLPEDDVLLHVEADGQEPASLVVPYPRVSDLRKADVMLHPGTSLAGQISVPPEGVEGPFHVSARRRDGGGEIGVEAEADGRFAFPNLSDTAYDLHVGRRRAGRSEHLVTVENVLPGVEEHVEVRLPALRALRGAVDELRFEGPAVYVLVETQRYDPEQERHVWGVAHRAQLTPSGRRAEFEVAALPPGLYTVRVTQGALDTGTLAVRLDAEDIDGLELRLPAGGRIAGAVLDEDGAPLLGAHVRITRLHGDDAAPPPAAGALERRSDERGDFMVDRLAPGLWRVDATFPERAPAQRVVRLLDGEVLVIDDLLLDAGGALEGRVEDAEGRSLDSVVVHARRFDGDGPVRILRTDGEGYFRAPHLRPGAWLLRVAAATVAGGPWIEAVVEVVAGETATVQFTAGDEGSLGGTLRRRGLPVAGAVVDVVHDPARGADPLRRYRTSTGVDGRFRVDQLQAGHYTLQVQSGAWRVTEGVDLEAGDELELDLEAFEGRLRGTVVGRDGRPVAGASIIAKPLDEAGRVMAGSGFVGEGRTDPLGAFVLRGLPPGSYHVSVSAPGHPPGVHEQADADLPGADFPIQIVLGRGGDLELTVEDERERGITGASVWLEDEDGVSLHRHAYRTGAGGRLRMDGVPSGTVRVRVHARGYGRPALRTLTIEEGRVQTLRIALGPPGSIHLQVSGDGEDPRPRARIDILRAGTREVLASRRPLSPIRLGAPWGYVPRTGVARFDDLAAGRYLVRISAGRQYAVAEVLVEVKTGLAAEVHVKLLAR